MIAGFLGQTATKTEEVIRSAFGGVLVIDEASSLADGRSTDNSDSFSKSCLDTLNRMLSEHGDKFVCILSGYKKEIYRDILAINPGLRRRFSIHFEVEPYSAADLRCIFEHKIHTCPRVTAGTDAIPDVAWFQERKRYFPHYGGDCEVLLSKSLTMAALRTFGATTEHKHVLTRTDVEQGFARLKLQYTDNDADTEYETMRLFYT
jgi:SpoVK/Ycf46/Vps4 family AAA+-type ATPase